MTGKLNSLHITKIIIIAAFCMLFSSKLNASAFKLLLVTDKVATFSQQISYNLGKALSDSSIKFDILDREDIPAFTKDKLADYRAVVFMAEKVSAYVFAQDLLDYVKNGGIVCVAFHDYNNEWMKETGINTAIADELNYLEVAGFASKEPIFKDIHVNIPEEQFSTTALDLRFSKEWRTRISYPDTQTPMLCEREYGNGHLIFFNTSSLSQKSFRGIFLFSLFRKFKLAAFSVLNTSLFHLDDSPPPGYGLREGPVNRDLKMTDKQFHLRVWQKSFLPMLDEFKITPTHYMCLRYDDKIEPPFPVEIDREPFFSQFLKELQRRGHELGFHGYNHQSLTIGASPAKPWTQAESMKASNEAAYAIWIKYQLPPTMVYVPPNNVIDQAGKQSVIDGFPTIRVISRLYNDSGEYRPPVRSGFLIGAGDGDFNNEMMKNIFSMYASRKSKSGNSAAMMFAGDEFGFDPEIPQILNLPRISSGHSPDGYMRLQILNGIMAHGATIHFLHPDDIYDPARREDTWEKTLMAARRTLLFFENAAGHLQKNTTNRYIRDFRRYIFAKTSIDSPDPEKLLIEPDGRDFFYLFVGKNRRPVLKNARIISEIEPERLFLVEAQASASITLE